jgi:hypothetical protein
MVLNLLKEQTVAREIPNYQRSWMVCGEGKAGDHPRLRITISLRKDKPDPNRSKVKLQTSGICG